MSKPGLAPKLRVGIYVFGALLAIELVEFVIGTTLKSRSWPYLAVLALIGAWPILRYFMHLPHPRVRGDWRRKE